MAISSETKERTVRDQLLWDDRISASDIEVTVTDSKAILSGTVGSYSEKLAAEDDALHVPGITAVESDIKVKFPEAYTVLSDTEIKDSIENMIASDSRLDAKKINVSVDAGIVTLSGSVDAFWKKAVAEDFALGVSGVVDVIDNLDVTWVETYDDAKIASDVRDALERSALVDSDKITVEVTNGVVTLRGQVNTSIAKRTAYNQAERTAGVKGVINEIEVTVV